MYQKQNAPNTGGKRSVYLSSSLYSPTFNDGLAGFQDAMAAAKLGRPDIQADGEIHRFRVADDKGGTLNGWYVFFPVPVAAGAFGSWKTGQSEKWCIKSEPELSHAERKELARQLEAARQARKAGQRKVWELAADKAVARFRAAKPMDGASIHDYLKRKHVRAHGLRLEGQAVLVPLRDIAGRLWSLQTINRDGEKRFMGGGKTSGMFHLIGTVDPAGALYIAEGYATGATVHKLRGVPVVCAMTADNLLPVALAFRTKYPQADIVIAGDNDRFTDGNPGAVKAEAAARAVGGAFVLPDFPPNCTTGTDFNDLMLWESAPHG